MSHEPGQSQPALPIDPAASAVPASPPRPRRRLRRALLWLLLVGLALAVVVAAAGSWLLENHRLSRLLSARLSTLLKTRVTLEIERRGLGIWELRHLALGGDSLQAPDLELARLGLYAQPGLLWKRRLHLDSLVVEGLRLNLAWRDSLIPPTWLDLSDTTQRADTSSLDLPRYLRLLADNHWCLDSTRIVLRGALLTLRGSQAGQPLDLAGPPLALELRTPHIGPDDFRELARRRLPPRVLAGMHAGWSGDWRDGAAGAPWRPLPLPPGLRETLALSGLGLARRPLLLQQLDFRLELARDTLRLAGRLALRPSDLSLSYDTRDLPLPERLEATLEMAWPVRAQPLRAGLDLGLRLEQEGLSTRAAGRADMRQAKQGWRATATWRQELDTQLERLGMLDTFEAPALTGRLSLTLEGSAELLLDSTWAAGRGSCRETLRARSAALGLPDYGLSLEGLDLTQTLGAELDLAQALPLRPRMEVSARLERLALGTPPLEDPRQLDLRLSLVGGGPCDSLTLAADLGVASWFGGRVDLSAGGRLPALREWLDDYEAWLERPERLQGLPLWLDLETSTLVLDGLDPSLAGGLRASAHFETGRGLRFRGEAVPDGLRLRAAGQELDLPLHRLEFEGGAVLGDLYAELPWPDTLWVELRPDPLPALSVQLGHREGAVRLKADWRQLDLPRLLALLPPAWQPAGVELGAGTGHLQADIRLDEGGAPVDGTIGLALAGATLGASGYRVESLETRLELALDTLGTDYSLDLRASALVQEEPAWSWEGLTLAGSGRLDLPLALVLGDTLWLEPGRGGPQAAEGRFTLELESLDLAGTVEADAADWRGLLPDLVSSRIALGGKRQLRPWPGLRMTGTLDLEQRLARLPSGAVLVEGRALGRLDSLDWQQDAHVEQLVLDLPFRQELVIDPLFAVDVPVDGRRQPVDWNALRGWNRGQPDFAPAAGRPVDALAGRGWSLRMALARYGAWSAEALAADVRVGQGRLDVPEFRCGLFGGGVRGALSVVGVDTTRYALDCSLIGLDSRYFEFGDRTSGSSRARGLVNAVMHLEGAGLDLGALDQLRGQLRMPELDRQVTLNLLRALDAQGVDPSIGKVRRLLELPGFRYRVGRVDFDVAHGFARPRVALKKSLFSPLPDVSIPMSPLPLGFMIRNFALAEEDAP